MAGDVFQRLSVPQLILKEDQIILEQEPMSRSLQLPYLAYVTAFLQTDLFLVHLFFCEREVIPIQWHSDVS